jgi:MYXO-CTERM domain-containing protein
VRPVDRDTVLWTLVLFFGASIMFAAIREVTRDEGTGMSLGAQLVAGLALVGAVVLFVRRRR